MPDSTVLSDSLEKSTVGTEKQPNQSARPDFADLNNEQHVFTSSARELKQFIKLIGNRSKRAKPSNLNREIDPRLNRDCHINLDIIDELTQKGIDRVLSRQNREGCWRSQYLGGPIHGSMRLIALSYLQAPEPLCKTKAAILDLLASQGDDGGFSIYPSGDKSKAVTRLVYLAVLSGLQVCPDLLEQDSGFAARVKHSLSQSRHYVQSDADSNEWLIYTVLADLCWQVMAPQLPQVFPPLPMASSTLYVVMKAGLLGWFQSIMHEILPAMLILFQPKDNKKWLGPIIRWEQRWLKRLTKRIVQSQDGDGAWVETIVATSLNAMALKMSGFSLDHPALKKAVKYLQQSAELHEDNTVTVNWAVGNMWDTALHADLLNLAQADSVKRVAQSVFPHFLSGQRQDHRWSFSIDGYITDNDSSSITLFALSHLYPYLDPRLQKSAIALINQGCDAILNHQQRDGGWSTFDAMGIPFLGYATPSPERGAFFDFSSPDVTGRVLVALIAIERLGLLSSAALAKVNTAINRGITYLTKAQHEGGKADGSFWSRWLLGPLAGTCFSVVALRSRDITIDDSRMQRARAFVLRTQNRQTGGWGETADADLDPDFTGEGPSTPLQTSLAIMSLIAVVDERDQEARAAIYRGVQYLLSTQRQGEWRDDHSMGTILIGIDYFITPENSELAILATLILFRVYLKHGSAAAVRYWVTRELADD